MKADRNKETIGKMTQEGKDLESVDEFCIARKEMTQNVVRDII